MNKIKFNILTKEDLWRKTTFDGRRPLTEDDLWRYITWKNCWQLLTLAATAQLTPNQKSYQNPTWWEKCRRHYASLHVKKRRLLILDDFWCKTIFARGWHFMGENLWWEATIDRSRPGGLHSLSRTLVWQCHFWFLLQTLQIYICWFIFCWSIISLI